VSNCSQETVPTTDIFPTCLAGYPKPSWQNAPGVPNDQVRDLPDVSLFASNGANLSATPICANPGDCAPVSSGDPQVFLVGGTSVSSPSMAGVMALINQKYGRQGQANYTLYALARQNPNVFHDITLGTNDITCFPGSAPPDCNIPVPNSFLDSYGIYAAGLGYDLASGLGSVDVNQLLKQLEQDCLRRQRDYARSHSGQRRSRLGCHGQCRRQSKLRLCDSNRRCGALRWPRHDHPSKYSADSCQRLGFGQPDESSGWKLRTNGPVWRGRQLRLQHFFASCTDNYAGGMFNRAIL